MSCRTWYDAISMKRNVFTFALVAVISLLPTAVRAQCPDPVERILTFPADRANDVPVNVVLHVDFPVTQVPEGQPTWRVLDSHAAEVEGTEGWDNLSATFTPVRDLDPRTPYYVRVSVAATGQFLNFEFNTGTERDNSSPSFSGLSDLSWSHQTGDSLLSNCSISSGDGIIYSLSFSEGSDDGPREGLCYEVYQTSGPGISGSTLVARVRYPGDELNLMLPAGEGEGDICFRVQARDLLGRVDGNGREQCVEAVLGAVFDDACSVSGAAPRPGAATTSVLFWLLLGILIWRRARQHN